MRESLSSSCSPDGSTDMFEWFSSTRSDAAVVADGDREVEALVLDTQLVEVAQRLPGEVPDLGVVAFGLELGDHDRPGGRRRVRRSGRSTSDRSAARRCRARRCAPPASASSTSRSWTSAGVRRARALPLHPRVADATRILLRIGRGSTEANLRGRSDRTPCPMCSTLSPRCGDAPVATRARRVTGVMNSSARPDGHRSRCRTRRAPPAASRASRRRSMTCGAEPHACPPRIVALTPWLCSAAASTVSWSASGSSTTMPARSGSGARRDDRERELVGDVDDPR